MIEIARNEVRYEGFVLRPCGDTIGFFDCGKKDLNEFFTKDYANYEKQLLAKTYGLFPDGGAEDLPKALISFCNDAIRAESFENMKDFNKIRNALPWGKRYRSLPAVKIARLGVDKKWKRKAKTGSLLLNMTKLLFLTENRTGCRYLTVDAYRTKEAVEFYKYNDFIFMQREEEQAYDALLENPEFEFMDSDETVSMYFSLAWLAESTEMNVLPLIE